MMLLDNMMHNIYMLEILVSGMFYKKKKRISFVGEECQCFFLKWWDHYLLLSSSDFKYSIIDYFLCMELERQFSVINSHYIICVSPVSLPS